MKCLANDSDQIVIIPYNVLGLIKDIEIDTNDVIPLDISFAVLSLVAGYCDDPHTMINPELPRETIFQLINAANYLDIPDLLQLMCKKLANSLPNVLWDLISRFPDEPWNWNAVSRNPTITME